MKWRETKKGSTWYRYTAWTARKKNCTVDVQSARGEGYYFLAHHKPTDECFNSLWKHAPYSSVESAQQAAEQSIDLFATEGVWSE